jgi:hypothetical protein
MHWHQSESTPPPTDFFRDDRVPSIRAWNSPPKYSLRSPAQGKYHRPQRRGTRKGQVRSLWPPTSPPLDPPAESRAALEGSSLSAGVPFGCATGLVSAPHRGYSRCEEGLTQHRVRSVPEYSNGCARLKVGVGDTSPRFVLPASTPRRPLRRALERLQGQRLRIRAWRPKPSGRRHP